MTAPGFSLAVKSYGDIVRQVVARVPAMIEEVGFEGQKVSLIRESRLVSRDQT